MLRVSLRGTIAGLLLLTSTVAVVELAVRVVARLSIGLTPKRARAEREAFLAKIPALATTFSGSPDRQLDATHRRYVDMAYGARYELHPYFGHTLFRNGDRANNNGFYTDKTYPYRKGAREFVIGVFGGSVAMQITSTEDTLIARLRPKLRDLGYDTVTVLPFSVGGWRQPQSFYALVYYLDSIDMAILVDGFNEAVHLIPAQLQAYPARFPASDIFRPLASETTSPYEAARLGKLALAHEAAAHITGALNGSLLRRSILVHLAWRALAAGYLRYTSALRSDGGIATQEEWRDFEPVRDAGDVERNIESYLRFYASVIRYASLIAHSDGKLLFHFVQPNQHDRGSKPLSDEEQRSFVTAPWFDVITPRYRWLESMCSALQVAGVDSTSLSHLFARTTETVYADSCCHLNPLGLRLLNEAIADHVLASGALDRLAQRSGP